MGLLPLTSWWRYRKHWHAFHSFGALRQGHVAEAVESSPVLQAPLRGACTQAYTHPSMSFAWRLNHEILDFTRCWWGSRSWRRGLYPGTAVSMINQSIEPSAYSAISSSLLSSTRRRFLGGLSLLIIGNELYFVTVVCRRTLCLYHLWQARIPEASFLKPLHHWTWTRSRVYESSVCRRFGLVREPTWHQTPWLRSDHGTHWNLYGWGHL